MRIEVLLRRDLDDLAEIHHGDAVAQVPDHRKIVRDEDVGEAEAVAQRLEQVDDLRLDRDVERRDRLVADDEVRLRRERARNADALALAAGEFVRDSGPSMPGLRPTMPNSSAVLSRLSAALRRKPVHQHRLGHGLADRHARIERARTDPGTPSACGGAAAAAPRRRAWSAPCRRSCTSPAVGRTSCRMARPSVDLPQPLSPTSPSVSPRRMSRSTPSTACTVPTGRRRSSPPSTGKCTASARSVDEVVG